MAYLANKKVYWTILILFIFMIGIGTYAALNSDTSDDAPSSYAQGQLKQTTLNAPDYSNCGSTFLSIDRIEDQYTEFLRAHVVANGGGECGKVIFSQQDLNNKLGAAEPNENNMAVSRGATLSIQTEETLLSYPLIGTLWDYDLLSVEGDDTLEFNWCTIENCEAGKIRGVPANSKTVGAMRQGIYGFPCWCVLKDKAADIKDIGNIGQFSTTTNFKLEGVGEKSIITSGLGAAKTVTIGDKAIIKWVGYMQGDFQISSPTNYRVAQPTTGNAIVITRENLYTPRILTDKLDVIATNCISLGSQWWEQVLNYYNPFGLFFSAAQINECKTLVNEYDTLVNNELTNDKRSELIYGPVESIDLSATGYQGSGGLKYNLDTNSVAFPQFVVDLDAEWMGIHKIVGLPKVTCPPKLDLTEGERGDVKITVQNLHTQEAGVFDVFVACGGSVMPTHISRVKLVPGGSQIVDIQNFASSVTKDSTARCDVVVRSVNTLFGYAPPTSSCYYDVNIKNVDTCVPGSSKCSPNWQNVITCQADGLTEQSSPCNYGCKYDSGKAVCQTVCAKETQQCAIDSDCCFADRLLCKSGACTKNIDPTDYCDTCTDWAGSLFKKEADQCKVQKVFEEEKCDFWDVGCKFHNSIVPDWNQKEFCPIIFGMIGLFLAMVLTLVLLVLKKKGIIGKSKGFSTKSYKPKSSTSKLSSVGWRGK